MKNNEKVHKYLTEDIKDVGGRPTKISEEGTEYLLRIRKDQFQMRSVEFKNKFVSEYYDTYEDDIPPSTTTVFRQLKKSMWSRKKICERYHRLEDADKCLEFFE